MLCLCSSPPHDSPAVEYGYLRAVPFPDYPSTPCTANSAWNTAPKPTAFIGRCCAGWSAWRTRSNRRSLKRGEVDASHLYCFPTAVFRERILRARLKATAHLLLFPVIGFVFWSVAPSLFAQKVPVAEQTLPNGMRLLLVERHDDPTIAGGWVAHVGSANERPGITGIAHLFEHMMFKGTHVIGTRDYDLDARLIDEQETVMEEMRAEISKLRAAYRRGEIDDITKPEAKTPRMKQLEARFDSLVAQQRPHMIKNEFDLVVQKNGGSRINAFTNEDMTFYFYTLPANKLELYFWMEADRLQHRVFREFYSERDVVYEGGR